MLSQCTAGALWLSALLALTLTSERCHSGALTPASALGLPSFNTDEPSPAVNVVFGGSVADDEIRRYVVGILYQTDSGPKICTGTLISASLVITAAHCHGVRRSAIEVHFVSDMTRWSETPQRQKRKVVSAATIAGGRNYYDGRPHPEDIMVLHLDRPAPPQARYMRIATGNDVADMGTITAAGFAPENGRNRLRRATIPIVLTSRAFVVTDQSRGTGICQGDSGGPLYAKDDANGDYVIYAVIGSVLDVPGVQKCRHKAHAARTDSHAAWIAEQVRQMDPSARVQFGREAAPRRPPAGQHSTIPLTDRSAALPAAPGLPRREDRPPSRAWTPIPEIDCSFAYSQWECDEAREHAARVKQEQDERERNLRIRPMTPPQQLRPTPPMTPMQSFE